MKRMVGSLVIVIFGALAGLLLMGVKSEARQEASPTSSAADDAATPKFSTIASAEDLAKELNSLVADVEKAVANEDEYNSQIEGRFVRDGNTIALVATALGLHDQESPAKAHAQAVADAAGKLSAAKDYAAAKKAVEDLKTALESGAASGQLKWGKIATLKSLMKDEVPNINKKLKVGLGHFKKRSKEAAANAATMALIAENAKLYIADTKKPDEGSKWTAFANQFRDAADEVAAKIHAGDESGANAAMDKLNQSCHDCHAVFNPDKVDSKE